MTDGGPREVGRCQVCNAIDKLEVVPLGTRGESATRREAVNGKFCRDCHRRLEDYYGDLGQPGGPR